MRKAVTLAELMIVMVMMGVLGLISAGTFLQKQKDPDISKFRHAYTSVSMAVSELVNDSVMYPYESKGIFANENYSYAGETKVYGGKDKFKKLFRSKFNVFKVSNNVKFDYNIPLYELKNGRIVDASTIECFSDNKGFSFCPPKFPNDSDIDNLEKIYIPVFFTARDKLVSEVFFITSNKNGNMEIPIVVKNSSKTLVDCSNKNHSSYVQCKMIENLHNFNY